jgi:PPP family 3-phenylpropionic acid transporter
MDPARVGILLALGPVSRFLFPALWGLWADRVGHRKQIVILSLLGSSVVFAMLFRVERFWGVAMVLFVYGFFLAPAVPLVDGMVQEQAGGGRPSYGRVRPWGSFGFIGSTIAFGMLLDRIAVHGVLFGILIASVAASLSAVGMPATSRAAPHPPQSLRRVLKRPEILRFLAATTLMQASHGAYYAYFSLHLDRHGFTRTAIGIYWTLGVAAEIVLMLFSAPLLRRSGPAFWISLCLGIAAFRWLLLARGVDPVLLALGQTLHAFSFGLFHVCAVRATHELFPPALRSSGQSLYNALTYGLGNLLGFLGCGALAGSLGTQGLFALSAAVAALGWLISLRIPRRPAWTEP